MKNPVCEKLLLYQPTSSEDVNLRSWYIVNSVFNAFLAITAIILNSVTIQALRKTSSLPKPLKTLLLSLAVSDLAVGLLVEPFYLGLLVNWLQRSSSSEASCTVLGTLATFVTAASFMSVMALSGDTFLAVHLHLRYQELVTHKRVVAVVISIWMFSVLQSLFYLWVSSDITCFVFVISDLDTGTNVFSMSSVTLLFLNSSLNPVIYCWKMRQIRSAVMDIVRNIFPTQNN